MTPEPDDVLAREQAFWDEEVPPLEKLQQMAGGPPDPNVEAMFAALGPLAGRRVLDFACGGGVTSVWLAQRGAEVTGIDLSPVSIERSRELAAGCGVEATFEEADLAQLEPDSFDAIVGRYALHHVDCGEVGPALARVLRPGGVAAFVETMGTNPVLTFARHRLAGRIPGIPRYGTDDEHPLTEFDLDQLRRAFGDVRTEVAELRFATILDRQVLHYRYGWASRAARRADRFFLDRGWDRLSYHQVVICHKPPEIA